MTDREQQIIVDGLVARVDALEQTVKAIQTTQLAPPAPAPRGRPNGSKLPHWMTFVRWGNKPCAGGCGTTIPTGDQAGRVWYEPAGWVGNNGSAAQIYCEPCGLARGGTP